MNLYAEFVCRIMDCTEMFARPVTIMDLIQSIRSPDRTRELVAVYLDLRLWFRLD